MSDAQFRKAFGLIAFAMNRHLAQYMRRASRSLDTDLESVFVWATLAHLNTLTIARPGTTLDQIPETEAMLYQEIKPVRLADIAQVTGLPRETVRRKLTQLAARGKVERSEDGLWRYRPDGIDKAAYEMTREMAGNLLQTAAEVQRLLQLAQP
jgi:CRP-like cAMP-binding protein